MGNLWKVFHCVRVFFCCLCCLNEASRTRFENKIRDKHRIDRAAPCRVSAVGELNPRRAIFGLSRGKIKIK